MLKPWPRCQFTYEDETLQCMWNGCAEGHEFCGIHQDLVNARARSKARKVA